MEMKEFTFRAVLIGLVLTGILGSANAYLGLKAGMTIAATYPAAVIGMALLRLMKGSLLEENIARTVGSIGESVAAGRDLHHPRLRDGRFVARLDPRLAHSRILEVGGPDDDRRHPRNYVRHPPAPRDGRRSRSSLSRVGRRLRDSQSRPARLNRRQDSLREHGIRRLHVPAGRGQHIQPEQHLQRHHRQSRQKIAAAHQHQSERRHHHHRRRDPFHRARRQPRLSRRGIHHRPAPRRVELCRRRARLGIAGSAPNLHHRSLHSGRTACRTIHRVAAAGAIHLFFHREADCRRRHARRRILHALQDAQAARPRHGARRF